MLEHFTGAGIWTWDTAKDTEGMPMGIKQQKEEWQTERISTHLLDPHDRSGQSQKVMRYAEKFATPTKEIYARLVK